MNWNQLYKDYHSLIFNLLFFVYASILYSFAKTYLLHSDLPNAQFFTILLAIVLILELIAIPIKVRTANYRHLEQGKTLPEISENNGCMSISILFVWAFRVICCMILWEKLLGFLSLLPLFLMIKEGLHLYSMGTTAKKAYPKWLELSADFILLNYAVLSLIISTNFISSKDSFIASFMLLLVLFVSTRIHHIYIDWNDAKSRSSKILLVIGIIITVLLITWQYH